MGAALQTPGTTLGWCIVRKSNGAKSDQTQNGLQVPALKAGRARNRGYEGEAP